MTFQHGAQGGSCGYHHGGPILKKAGSAEDVIALRAMLSNSEPLSEGERSLLVEWINRLARQ